MPLLYTFMLELSNQLPSNKLHKDNMLRINIFNVVLDSSLRYDLKLS